MNKTEFTLGKFPFLVFFFCNQLYQLWNYVFRSVNPLSISLIKSPGISKYKNKSQNKVSKLIPNMKSEKIPKLHLFKNDITTFTSIYFSNCFFFYNVTYSGS
jgi:hypothetical protein